MDAAGHARHPRQGSARGAARHHPAVPHVLGDLRRRAEGPARPDRRRLTPARATCTVAAPARFRPGRTRKLAVPGSWPYQELAVPAKQVKGSIMRAAGIPRYSAPVEPLELPGPGELRPDEVLLEVRGCGVGNWDESPAPVAG